MPRPFRVSAAFPVSCSAALLKTLTRPRAGGERLLQLLVHLQHALVGLGIPDGHRGLMRQGLQEICIVAEVRASRPLRPRHDESEQPPLFEEGSHHIGVEVGHFSTRISRADNSG